MNPTTPDGTSRRQQALADVAKCVCSDRQNTYGDAEDNFIHIANLWTTYRGVPFSAVDVAAMSLLIKVARMRSSPNHRDNWIDAAGYAVCGAGIVANLEEQGRHASDLLAIVPEAPCIPHA